MEKQFMDVSQKSKRDTTRYVVQWHEYDEETGWSWQNVDGYEKPMSKGKAVAVFFMQWMKLNVPKSIDEVREIFPTSLNAYYSRNRQKGVYDSLIWFSSDDVHAETESGFKVDIQKEAGWDLYPVVPHNGEYGEFGLGYAPVWEGDTCTGKAMIAKMWRKDDFDNFLEYIDKNSEKYFSRVRIVKRD